MENTVSSEDTQVYVPDPDGSVSLDPEITLAQGQPRPRNHTVRLQGRQARHAHHVEYLPDEFR